MRLGQLARKLEIKPSEIVDYLKINEEVEISVHPNSKIPDELIDAVKNHFAKAEPIVAESESDEVSIPNEEEKVEELIESQIEETSINDSEAIIEEKEAESISNDTESVEEESAEVSSEEIEPIESPWEGAEFIPEEIKAQAETIKAPKINLDGVTVVGKIDLPEPKAKEVETENGEEEDATSESTANPKKKRTKKHKPRKKFTPEERKAYHEKKKQEAHDKKIKEQKEASKKAHYAKILEAQKEQTNRKNNKKKKKEAKNPTPAKKVNKSLEPQPTSLWGKFKKWLNDS